MSHNTNHMSAPTTLPRPSRRSEGAEPPDLPQYSLRRILGVWAAAALPMGLLAWVAAPLVAHVLDGPSAWPRAIVGSLTVGLVWQFVLVLVLVHREQGSLRWSVLKQALWLRKPQSPRSGRRGGRLWLITIPLIVAVALKEELISVPAPVNRDTGLFLQSSAGHEFFSGNWPWFAVIVAMMIFNTVLGEELLFRGLLLPRMRGTFGRWDWVANGALWTVYHLHVPWAMPSTLVESFLVAYPSRRYRSTWIGIIVHSAQTVVFTGLILALVLQ